MQVPMAMKAQSVRLLTVLYVSDAQASTSRSTLPAAIECLGKRERARERERGLECGKEREIECLGQRERETERESEGHGLSERAERAPSDGALRFGRPSLHLAQYASSNLYPKHSILKIIPQALNFGSSSLRLAQYASRCHFVCGVKRKGV